MTDFTSDDPGTRGAPAPIAIVGMSCRFGGANDLHGYWRLNVEGRDAFAPVPADRWDVDAFYDANPRAADKSYSKIGAWIDDVRSFPAVALQVPPRRIEVMDPQQRMTLEVCLEAVADSGRTPAELPARTGVYMGVTSMEWRTISAGRISAQLIAAGQFGTPPEDLEALAHGVEKVVPYRPFSAPGVLGNMIAATAAQELGVKGPAYTTDAACASGLVAIADAVYALREGRLDAALAGGVYLCLSPEQHIGFSRVGAMSREGRCLPFDARADGFVQGDGCGVMVLKRLADARRDGDTIYAVLRGISLNNDGGGEGPMAPVQSGQVEAIQLAWADAPDIAASDLGYVEAHGTGTTVGDRIELAGLREALGQQGASDVVIGSSKANVGHTMSAAGVAGVMRAALAIHHETLPPMAGFESPKPELDLDTSGFRIPTAAEPWTADRRVAAVSSFGFGGTNVHCVLEGAPEAPAAAEATDQPELVPISAPDDATLRDLAGRTAAAIADAPAVTVAGVARAWAARPTQPQRLAVVAGTVDELTEKLAAVSRGEHPKGVAMGRAADEPPKVAFMYPGQGAQRTGMIAGIRDRFPVAAETLDACDAILDGAFDVPLSHLLYPERRATPVDADTASSELTDTQHCQPALFAVGAALTRILDQAGVRPDVVVGHSVGEFTAAYAGGVVDLANGARWVTARGGAMSAMTGDRGAMVALVMDDPSDVDSLLVDGAVVANVNHPRQVVVSGTTEAVAAVTAAAEAREIQAVRLEVSHGFHSPVFETLDLDAVVDGLELSDPSVPVASCIADQPYGGADDARAVFKAHATSPVLFTRALAQCRELGAEVFLQVGAGGPLRSFARGTFKDLRRGVLSLASKEDADGGASLLLSLGELWVRGVHVDAAALAAEAPVVSVPPVVYDRQDYWVVRGKRAGRISLTGASAPTETAVEAAPAEPPPEAPAPDDVAEIVMSAVARTSAYPRDALKPEMALGADLGFDSMMVADLVEELTQAIDGLDGIPQELLIKSPTIADLIAFAKNPTTVEVGDIDDDAPLARFAPTWVAAPLPGWGDGPLPATALVLGHPALAAELEARGLAASEAPEVLVFVADLAEPIPVSAVLAGETAMPDPAEALIAALDAAATRGDTPHVLVLRRDDDPWSEGATGALRAVARDWTDQTCKSLRLDAGLDAQALADVVVAELTTFDLSTDVGWRAGGRFVLGATPIDGEAEAWAPGAEDTVLVTGGTRGIGLQVATRAADAGATVLLMGRSAPGADAQALVDRHPGRVHALQADVTDRAGVAAAVAPYRPTALLHAAGVLADGALGSVDPAAGRLARHVKATGFLNAVAACGTSLRLAAGVGSWAGRFGSRHQAHYGAGNAMLARLVDHLPTRIRGVVSEFGPWTDSDMVRSIPAAVQKAMRASGVDFVGSEAGMNALLADLGGSQGAVIRGRRVTPWTRRAARTERLAVETHPYLADHAIDDRPVLPLAGAATLLADAAGVQAPFELRDLTLFQGVAATEPVEVAVAIDGATAELRTAGTLCYRATVTPAAGAVDAPAPAEGGDAPTLSLQSFYDDVTFHGPLLQGITAIDGVGEGFVRGRVRVGRPTDWVPGTDQPAWAIDPLVLDSAMQLSAYVAWVRYQRAGTPVGIASWTQLAPLPESGEVTAEVWFAESDGDRFSGDIALRSGDGTLLAWGAGVTAQLREVEAASAPTGHDGDDGDDGLEGFELDPSWVDPAQWKGYKDLQLRLAGANALGLDNPYFDLHEGTARNTSVIDGREVVNYSSYNYLGLSGDPRIIADVHAAMERYGTSVSASRVASGERPFHRELEAGLAGALGVEDAIIFGSGHATNVTTIGHLFGPNDLVLHDELIHDSCLQGIKLSGAARQSFHHEDPGHLRSLLAKLRRHYEKVLILVEGAYSMDGDATNLPAWLELKERYGCLLMVDEAHSFGTMGATGCGVREHYGVDATRVDLWMGTMSKSLASMGGWIAGRKALIEYMRYTTPGFVFAAGMTPTLGQAALSALGLMFEEPWRVQRLQANSLFFYEALKARGIDTGLAVGESPVVPAITGDSMQALHLSQRLLRDAGINAKPIVFPAVANDAARLRFFMTALHTEEQLTYTADAIAETLAAVRKDLKR